MCVGKIGVTVILGAILKVRMRMVSWRRTTMVTW
jgi:hypothetical protein